MASRRRIRVLIPDGESSHCLKVTRCLGSVGVCELSILTTRDSIRVRKSRYATRVHQVSELDEKASVERAVEFAKKDSVNVILPIGEAAVRAFSELAPTPNDPIAVAPSPRPATFDLAVDKLRLAQFCSSIGVNVPMTLPLSELLKSESNPLPFPLLLKKRRGSFGRHVHRIESRDELLQFIRHHEIEPTDYLCQSFVNGIDVDASILCEKGTIRAYTLQRAHVQSSREFEPPAAVEFFLDDRILDQVEHLARSLEWNGIAHIDMRYEPGTKRLNIIELNARYWGSLLGSLSMGVNFPYLACRAALGDNVSPPVPRTGYYFGRGVLGRLKGQASPEYSIWRGNLRYALRDPMPELSSALRRMQAGSDQ